MVVSSVIFPQCPLGLTWQWYTANTLAPSVISILVLVDVVTQMEDVVYRVFAHGIPIGVEEAKRWQHQFRFEHFREAAHSRKLLHEYTARPILVTRSFGAGVVLVLPSGLVLFEPQTLNW